MALSQKHTGKILVPWLSSNEWKYVYDLIYNAHAVGSRAEALRMLKIWKQRMPLLSSGIEGTLIVLEALTADVNNIPENVVKCLYGTALMRFLNLCAANSDKQGTFYSSAKRNNIPDWIIDLRHDFAHAHDLPSLQLLSLSLKFALDWLEREYWSVHKNDIKDWIVDEPDQSKIDQLNRSFSILCEITRKTFHNEKVELSDYGEEFTQSMADKSKIKQVLISLLNKIREDSSEIQDKESFVNILIEKGDLLNEEYLQEDGKKLQKGLLNAWEYVFKYFMEKHILLHFLKYLYQVLGDWCHNENTKQVANLWIIEILNTIRKRKYIMDASLKEDSPKSALTFETTIEEMNKDIESFKEVVLNEPNKYARNFIKPLLELCNCTEDYIASTVDLIQNYTSVENVHQKSQSADQISKPISMEECQEMINKVEAKLRGNNKTQAQEDTEMECEEITTTATTRWKRVKDTSKYLGPLGTIIGHNQKNNVCFLLQH